MTGKLVDTLVADLQPVRRLPGAGRRAVRWAAVALLCASAGLAVLGARPDLAHRLREPAYLADGAALLLVFACSARHAFRLGVPGLVQGPLAGAAPVLAMLAWCVSIASRASPRAGDLLAGAASWTGGWPCVARMLGLALAPSAAILLALREAAPCQRARTGGFAILSASALAILVTQIVCMKDDPGHLLRWHVAPVVLAAVVGAAAGSAMFSPGRVPRRRFRAGSRRTRDPR